MLLFWSEDLVDEWCARKDVKRGEVVSVEQVWALAQAWYGNRLDIEYTGRSADEAQRILDSVGLRSAFWRLQP